MSEKIEFCVRVTRYSMKVTCYKVWWWALALYTKTKAMVFISVAVVVAFFLCWAPFHAQRLLAVYLQDAPEETQEAWKAFYVLLLYASGILYYLSTTINPVLYNIMSNKFRDAFKVKCRESFCFIFLLSLELLTCLQGKNKDEGCENNWFWSFALSAMFGRCYRVVLLFILPSYSLSDEGFSGRRKVYFVDFLRWLKLIWSY